MSRFIDDRKDCTSEKIDLLIKIIARTDGYLSSANTKSTILLSLSSALFAAILLNYDKFLNRLQNIEDKYVLSLFALISLFLLLMSIYYSLKGVTPFLKPSTQKNIYSFVDLKHYFDDVAQYTEELNKKTNMNQINSLSALNYILAGALLDKYYYHSKSIECISISLLSLGLMALLIILSGI